MKTSRIAATGVLTAALLFASGCSVRHTDRLSASSSATDSGAAARLIDFDKKNDGGVILRKPADVSKLTGTPDGFRQFMAGVIDTNRNWGSPDKQCPTTISVVKYDISGYASGGIGDCGGAELMWGKWHGVWQQVWGGQSIPECRDLKRYEIPVSIAGNQCWDGTKSIAYTG